MKAIQSTNHRQILSALFGLAVGDALGVPVEFQSRSSLSHNPVTGMRAYGTHKQHAGTWSDDSSLAFCLAEALIEGFNPGRIAENFVLWKEKGYWTPRGEVFDIGNATAAAIRKLKSGVKPELAGGTDEHSNGNGSLMRILPLLFYTRDMPPDQRFNLTRLVSSITHAHIHSVIACFYYLEFARLLVSQVDKFEAYAMLKKEFPENLVKLGVDPDDLEPFYRLLDDDIFTLKERAIESDGYVVNTLEAATWCLMTTDSYPAAVLKAVNLGDDADTTAAVTGGLAGLLYGFDRIPKEWIEVLARREDIEDLCQRVAMVL